ncbi:class I SAM-dependent methyltransferase [Streptomyces sp. NBC_01511]|uniref:class I SAM-dependent methyltransferase n=1 Tax=Streptomyces sp. NBC_01511 TaxID=2903889 RepID=UPI003869FB2B
MVETGERNPRVGRPDAQRSGSKALPRLGRPHRGRVRRRECDGTVAQALTPCPEARRAFPATSPHVPQRYVAVVSGPEGLRRDCPLPTGARPCRPRIGCAEIEEADVKSQFDTAVAAYEQSVEEMPFREHIEAYSFLRAVGGVTGRDVLDLGCGSGAYARRLRREGAARAVGMDESTAMVEYARRREERERLGVEYLAVDASEPTSLASTELDGQFDVVTAVYVLPYAPTLAALAAFCATARRALRERGGRFVAAVLNPGFSPDPQYYLPHGMRLSARRPRREGSSGHMTAWVGQEVLDVDFFCWSAAAHEQALRAAGFHRISWIRPEVSEKGREEYGEGYWADYLSCPHALIIQAEAGPRVDPSAPDTQ